MSETQSKLEGTAPVKKRRSNKRDAGDENVPHRTVESEGENQDLTLQSNEKSEEIEKGKPLGRRRPTAVRKGEVTR